MSERNKGRFSRRFGHSPPDREITIREGAPLEFRAALLQISSELGLTPVVLRAIICPVLRKLPDPNNWTVYPNIFNEVQDHVTNCEWYRVYDIAEAIYSYLKEKSWGSEEFEEAVNEYLRETGIGWKLVEGKFETRGEEVFEKTVKKAIDLIESTGRATAKGELHEAIRDLSRRPDPDITGATQHAMAALECIARDITGNPKATLGEILKRNPTLLPKPLDEAVEKAWGYASEWGRHLREGRTPTRAEGEVIVGIVATISNFLINRTD